MNLTLASLAVGAVVGVTTAVAADVPWWAQLLIALAGTATTALIAMSKVYLVPWLKEKTKSEMIGNAAGLALDIVADYNEHRVEDIKAMIADGKADKQELADLKQSAIRDLKMLIDWDRWAKVFSGDVAERIVSNLVEGAHVSQKNARSSAVVAKAIAGAPDPSKP